MFKPRKVGWLDKGKRGLREGGGNCAKYLKRGWNRKEGRGNIKLKKGWQTGLRCGCLKKGGATGTPLRTTCLSYNFKFFKFYGPALAGFIDYCNYECVWKNENQS